MRLQPVRPPWRLLLGRPLCVPLPSAPRALLRRGGLLSGGRPKITRSTHVCVFPQCRAFLDAFSLSHRSHELHGVPEEAGLLGASWSVRGRRRWLPGSSLSAGSQSCEPFPAVCVASVHVTAETAHRGPGNISCQGDGAGERAGRPLGARRTQGESSVAEPAAGQGPPRADASVEGSELPKPLSPGAESACEDDGGRGCSRALGSGLIWLDAAFIMD